MPNAIMPNAIMPNAIMPNAIMQNAIMQNDIMQKAIMLNAIMLAVVAPNIPDKSAGVLSLTSLVYYCEWKLRPTMDEACLG